MAQSLDEQITVVERALGECMIDTALVVVRAWLSEIGESNPYEEAYASIQQQYRDLFTQWLNVEDPHAADTLTKLTGDTFQLVDAVYRDIRLKRGLSPDMHGFNPDSNTSVVHYFKNCVRLRPEDLEWLHELFNDEYRTEIGCAAISALSANLQTCFSIDAFMALIDGINAENDILAGLCVAYTMLHLMQHDVRIDFFPQIQDAFVDAISREDKVERVFEMLCALVRNEKILREIPGTQENELLYQVVPIIPQTWLYDLLIEGSTEREMMFAHAYLSAGYRDMLYDFPSVGERVYLETLRKGTTDPQDYINYAHCLLLQGDRMMAFENYRQARRLCASSKDFFAIFRPDRKQLVDHGIPVEHIYLMEDQLING